MQLIIHLPQARTALEEVTAGQEEGRVQTAMRLMDVRKVPSNATCDDTGCQASAGAAIRSQKSALQHAGLKLAKKGLLIDLSTAEDASKMDNILRHTLLPAGLRSDISQEMIKEW